MNNYLILNREQLWDLIRAARDNEPPTSKRFIQPQLTQDDCDWYENLHITDWILRFVDTELPLGYQYMYYPTFRFTTKDHDPALTYEAIDWNDEQSFNLYYQQLQKVTISNWRPIHKLPFTIKQVEEK